MKQEWNRFFRLGVTLFFLYLAIHYWAPLCRLAGLVAGACAPLILGGVIAYGVNILMSCYEGYYFPNRSTPFVQKSRRPVCLLVALATMVGLIFFLIRMILPELMDCVGLLIQKAVPVLEELTLLVNENTDLHQFLTEQGLSLSNGTIDWQSALHTAAQWLLSGLGGVMGSVVSLFSTLSSAAFTLVVSLIFSLYLLTGKERLLSQADRALRAYLKPVWYSRLTYFLHTLNTCFHRFLVGQCTEAVVLGLLCIGGMLLFRFPYATMIGTLIGFTALIPVAGAYIGAGVGAFMIFTVSPVRALLFLVFIVVLQQLEGNLIYPKIVGSSIGLPGIWVLTAVTIGGGILGIPGMLLAVPLAAACYQMVRQDILRREAARPPEPVEVSEET